MPQESQSLYGHFRMVAAGQSDSYMVAPFQRSREILFGLHLGEFQCLNNCHCHPPDSRRGKKLGPVFPWEERWSLDEHVGLVILWPFLESTVCHTLSEMWFSLSLFIQVIFVFFSKFLHFYMPSHLLPIFILY